MDLNEQIKEIETLEEKLKDKCIVFDADTLLKDTIDKADNEVTGLAHEVFDLYRSADDKNTFCRLFEKLTGTSFEEYLSCCRDILAAEIGETETENQTMTPADSIRRLSTDIRRLESCIEYNRQYCPKQDNADLISHINALKVAVLALEKNNPTTPASTTETMNAFSIWRTWRCPSCNAYLYNGTRTPQNPKYCPHCGQHLKWQ